MTWPIAFRIAARELRGGLRGFRVFLACLALGVAAIAAVGLVRAGIEAGLGREGAVLLGGDASLSFTYRFATDEERARIDQWARSVSEVADFRSMAVVDQEGTSDRALTQVKAVDAAYPLVVEVVLDPPLPLAEALAGRGDLPGAVMDPVLAARLGLEAGDSFQLGVQRFVLGARIVREPDAAGSGFALGPRTLVLRKDLADSGLMSAGTLFDSSYRIVLPEGADIEAVRQEAQAALEGTGMRWQDRRNGAPGVSEFVSRLSAFLVLVGLASLAVGGIGVSAAVRAYLERKTETIATLKTLGAENRTVFLSYFVQIGVLALLGIAAGLLLACAALFLLAPVLTAQLPVPADFAVYPGPLRDAALFGGLTAMLFTLWPVARTEEVRAATLYREPGLGHSGRPRVQWIIVTGLLLGALVGAAALLSGLAMLTLWAAAGLLASFLVLIAIAMLLRVSARRIARMRALQGRTILRQALAAIGGRGSDAVQVILSLGLGLTVLAAIGQIDSNLCGAIARDLPEVAPSYFVVDIQPDQLPVLRDRLGAIDGVSKVESAPMLRGIITRINDRPAAEVAGDHWVLSGDRGITYSATRPEGTELTEGSWWAADYDGPPLVSFAAEEAEEMGLKIGDSLTVNVMGRDITARIASFRNVDFSTAGIGFVLSMNPAALARAPHTHIATIYAEPETEARILRDLSGAFPNITAIRVRDAIDRVSEILRGIASAITYAALASLLTGAIVLIGAAAAGEKARTYEAAVLKTLGASRISVLANFAVRSVLLGAAAGCVAILAGSTAAWAVMRYVLNTDFHMDLPSAIGIVTGGIVLTLLAGLAFAWGPLATRPARILRQRE